MNHVQTIIRLGRATIPIARSAIGENRGGACCASKPAFPNTFTRRKGSALTRAARPEAPAAAAIVGAMSSITFMGFCGPIRATMEPRPGCCRYAPDLRHTNLAAQHGGSEPLDWHKTLAGASVEPAAVDGCRQRNTRSSRPLNQVGRPAQGANHHWWSVRALGPGGRRPRPGASTYFIPASRILCCASCPKCRVAVIGLHSLAMEKAPLRCGIASFSRRSESYSDGHHVFILECHFAHGGVYHQRGGVIPTEDGPARRA